MVDPALMLGAAVVKTACKIWLRDYAIAADATVGVVDIIQSKVAGTREQRRVSRLFEDLEERVADNVLSGMDVEFANVPANEREAAVLAVADTFDKAQLTNRDLFAADLAAPRLLRMMRQFTPQFTRDLSEAATALYDRVLADCCAYIVEVADVLPGFQVGVFSELLTRQHEILRHVDERFDRLPMQLGGAGTETFEPTFLRLVAKQLDKVELFGVTVSDRLGSYPLSVAYVSLSLSSTVRAGLANPERRVTSIEDGLGSTKRAFIRGEAGSGKTTLLQWLAVRCARRELAGPMREWHGSVPLFIRLRRYSGHSLPTPEEFLREVGRQYAPELACDLRMRLQDLATDLLPPKHVGQATALARAGDLVLELLSTREDYTPDEAVPTIRMATAIGGDEAMSIIARCARNSGQPIQRQLEAAWLKFDPEEFAVRVLRNFQFESTALVVEDPSLLAGVKLLGPKEIFCSFAHGHGDVDFIADLPHLEYLGVYDQKLTSVAPVANHPTLKSLALPRTDRVDISPVGRSASISSLSVDHDSIYVEGLREVSNVEVLHLQGWADAAHVLPYLHRELTLRGFGLYETREMTDLADLINAPQVTGLDYLALTEAHALERIADIEHWADTMLTLYLSAPRLADVARISGLPSLKIAVLRDTPVPSLDFLVANRELEQLDIGGAAVAIPDLAPLRELSFLRELRIYGKDQFDISGLAGAGEMTVEIAGDSERVTGLERLPESVQVRFGLQP